MVPDWVSSSISRVLMRLADSEALYFFAAYVTQVLIRMDALFWVRERVELISSLVIVPWGMALCLLRLNRRARNPHASSRADLTTLFLLLSWIVIPFAIRFGITFNNMNSWFNYTVVFFGLYALLSEADPKRRERTLDCVAALFAVFALCLAAPALYRVLTVSQYQVGSDLLGYGVDGANLLLLSMDHNTSAMSLMACALIPLIGFCRRKNTVAKLLYLIPSVMAMLTIVFTQSRTSRYALIVALAVGCYGYLCTHLHITHRTKRHAAALLAAGAVIVGMYGGARVLTNLAIFHYDHARARVSLSDAGSVPHQGAVLAEEVTDASSAQPQLASSVQRAAVDSTFSDRTSIWRNLFALWKEDPKHLIIGNGVGRTGSRIVQGTIHEAAGAVAVHNTYLQFIADFGLIGFALMVAFLCMMIKPWIHVFFAPENESQPGDRVLCMLVVVELLTGMMESQPLGAMSIPNLLLFFAFGSLYSRYVDLSKRRKGILPI